MPTIALPYSAAGVAIATAGVFAVGQTPLSASLPTGVPVSESPAIQLTTTVNPIQAWIDVFQETQTNVGEVVDFWLADPFPLASALLQNPLAVFDAVNLWNLYGSKPSDNSIAGLRSPVPNYDGLLRYTPQITAPLGGVENGLAFSLIYDAILAGELVLPEPLEPLVPLILDVYQGTASALSGAVIGSLGVVIGPGLAIQNQLREFVTELQDGNITEAVFALVNIPAAVTGAILNGGYELDLTNLVSRLVPDSSPISIGELKIPLAGIFSPPVDLSVLEASNPTVTGSLFQSLTVELDIPIFPSLTVTGTASGPIVSMQELGRAVGDQIIAMGEGAESEEVELAQESEGGVVAGAVAEDAESDDLVEDAAAEIAPAEDLAAEEAAVEDLAADEADIGDADAADVSAEDITADDAGVDDSGSEAPRWRRALQRLGDRVFNRSGSADSDDSSAGTAGEAA